MLSLQPCEINKRGQGSLLISYNSLDGFLPQDEPGATFHDANLLSLLIDYGRKELPSEWSICVGDPDAAGLMERERRRRGRLRFKGLYFWVVEPPENLEDKSRVAWLTSNGPLSDAKTDSATGLRPFYCPTYLG
jgi:hypothetical protein